MTLYSRFSGSRRRAGGADIDYRTIPMHESDLNSGSARSIAHPFGKAFCFIREWHHGEVSLSDRRARHQKSNSLAQTATEFRLLTCMAGVDDAALALGNDEMVVTSCNDITQSGLKRHYHSFAAAFISPPVGGRPDRLCHREPLTFQPAPNIEPLTMFTVGVYLDL